MGHRTCALPIEDANHDHTYLCPTDLKIKAYLEAKEDVKIAHPFDAGITILNVQRECLDKGEGQMLR